MFLFLLLTFVYNGTSYYTKLGGVVLSKQHPDEENVKEKVLQSLRGADQDTEKSEPTKRRVEAPSSSTGSRRQANGQTGGKKATKSKPKSTKTPKQPSAKKMPPLSEKKQEEYRRKSSREQENRVVSKIVTIVVVALLIMGSILAISIYRYVSSGLKPLDADNSEKIAVEIPQGSSNKAIGEILEKDNVIKSGMIFNYYTKFNNLTGFQAGKYNLSPDMTLDEISEALVNGTGGAADMKLTIPEGYDIDQIGDALAKDLKFKKKEFLALMEDETFFEELHKKYPQLLDSAAAAEGVRYRLEGYLFPATYDYYQGTDLKTFITSMVDKTNSVMSPYYQTITDKGLTVQQVLTLASLVEKEGNNESDRRKIAYFDSLRARRTQGTRYLRRFRSRFAIQPVYQSGIWSRALRQSKRTVDQSRLESTK